MLMMKIFAMTGLAGVSAVAWTHFLWGQVAPAELPNPTSGILALVGAITMIATALIGAYTRFREAKAQADSKDMAGRLETAQAEIERLKVNCKQWQDLYEAIRDGRVTPIPPPPSRTKRGST